MNWQARTLGFPILVIGMLLLTCGNGYAGSPWQDLADGIDEMVDVMWPAVSALAGVGILAMGLIEAWKNRMRPRRRFHSDMLSELVSRRIAHWKQRPEIFSRLAELKPAGKDDFEASAMDEVVDLATGGNADALFDLPVERLAGQLNAAMQIALAYPERYPLIVLILAHNADLEDIKVVLDSPPPAPSESPSPDQLDALRAYTDARNRITSLAQRNLDAIQIDWGNRWARRMRMAAVHVSSLIILWALAWYHFEIKTVIVGGVTGLDVVLDDSFQAHEVLFWLLMAGLGGMVAPVAKDLLASLQQVRNRLR